MPGEDRARKILDVDVREVSLVDRAANLRQFLVVKRLEDIEMGAFIGTERSNVMTEAELLKQKKDDEAKDLAKAEAAKKEEEAKAKAKKEEEAKAGKPKDKEDTEEDDETKAAKKKAAKLEEENKAMNPAAVAGMLGSLKGKGLPKAAVDELVTWLESQKAGAPEDKYPSPQGKPTKKSLSVSVLEDGSVVVEGEHLTKARKFTEARTGTVKEVVTQLMNLLNEVDEEAAKSLMASFKELPCGKVPGQEVKPVGTEGGQIIKQLEAMNADLTKRLEAIETARGGSKGVPDNGTDSRTVKKSMWSGVL